MHHRGNDGVSRTRGHVRIACSRTAASSAGLISNRSAVSRHAAVPHGQGFSLSRSGPRPNVGPTCLLTQVHITAVLFIMCTFAPRLQLPYTQERFTTTALNSLETNAEVAELRETYHADVVQMFGSFGPCGYA